MTAAALIEESPRWYLILDHLAENGGLEAGYRPESQEAFADELGVNVRNLRKYLGRMEELGVIAVERILETPSFGARRLPNLYRLLITADRWRDELGPAIVAQRLDRREKVRTARGKVATQEKARKERQRANRQSAQQASAPSGETPSTVVALARSYLAGDRSELVGW